MIHFKKTLYLSILCLIAYTSYAQERLLFHDCSEGLSQNTVASIVQDNQGFLWVATQYGLNRYDGHTYKSIDIHEGNQSAAKSNLLTSLAYDSINNELWIGSHGGGLTKINLNNYQKFHYNSSDHILANDHITTLYIDNDNLLWVANENAGVCIFRLDEQDKPFSSSLFESSQFKHDDIVSITGSGDYILMGTWSSGLIILNKATGFIRTVLEKEFLIRTIVPGAKNEFYVGSKKGLKKLIILPDGAIETSELVPELDNTVILSLLYDKESKLFIGTENEGLYTLQQNGQINKYVANSASLNQITGNSIWSLYKDNTDVTWIGLYLKGLNKIDNLENKFKKIQKFNCDNNTVVLDLVSTLGETENKLWIGTDGKGLYSFDKNLEKFKCHDFGPLGKEQAITTLIEGYENILWVGTWNDGVIKYDFINNKYELLNTSQSRDKRLSGEFVFDLYQDKNDNIWVSCFGDGLDVFNSEERIKSFDNNHLLSDRVRVIAENCSGEIILGTETSGIQVLNLDEDYNVIKTKALIKHESSNFNYAINDIKLDKSCNMWVATTNGLICINKSNEQLKFYSVKEGLPSNYIASIQFDDAGLLWGTTNQGIFSFDIQNETCHPYGLEDGLLSNEFLSSSSIKTKNGDIYFGNNSGINYYTNNQLVENKIVPPVVITSIIVSGKELDSLNTGYKYFSKKNRKTVFQYKNNDLTFKFSALNFSQSKLNQFKIRLKGLEKEWQEIGNKREIDYRNLRPGNYTFQVLGSNNDLVWNEEPAEFAFSITKAWYNSYLAWLIYTLLLTLLIYYIIRSILTRFKLREELRIEHLELQNLKEISELRSELFANISHELITPLTMIISPLKGIEGSTENLKPENAKMMLSNAERLMNYINQILNLSKLESKTIKLNIREDNISNFLKTVYLKFEAIAKVNGLTLEFDSSNENISLFYDEEKIEQVISNLLTNAIKYSKSNGLIKLSILDSTDEVIIKVTDNGLGIENKNLHKIFDRYFREEENGLVTGIGIGLSIAKQLIDLHKGEISIDSKKDQFTIFKITLKKGNAHFEKSDLNDPSNWVNTEDSIVNQVSADTIPEEEDDLTPVVLLVEDNPDIANYIISFLKDKYKVLWAKDGVEGLEKAMTQVPNVIISDVMMPRKNGYQLCQDLKSNELTNHISIILLTVKSSDDSQIKGYEYGADYYMTKPFTPQLLKLRIDNIIKHDHDVAIKLQKASVQNKNIPNESISDLDKLFLERSKGIILENLDNSKFSVSDLAKGLSFSNGQLYRKLKYLINQSSNEYIRTVRLNQAAVFLQEGQYNISEITYKVGFNDLKYFRTCFKKQFGVTPSDYKSQKIQVKF